MPAALIVPQVAPAPSKTEGRPSGPKKSHGIAFPPASAKVPPSAGAKGPVPESVGTRAVATLTPQERPSTAARPRRSSPPSITQFEAVGAPSSSTSTGTQPPFASTAFPAGSVVPGGP